MKQCPQCQFDDLLNTAAFCSRCGADLDRPAESHTHSYEDDSAESTELKDDSPLNEPMAGSSSAASTDRPTSKTEFRSLEDEDLGASPEPLQAAVYGSLPADDASPSTPPPVQAPETTLSESQQIRKLSSQEIKAISESMYSGTSTRPYLSDEEKRNLLRSIDKVETPAEKPTPTPVPLTKRAKAGAGDPAEPQRPKMADRLRGVSYFVGNFIMLSGNQRLRENDELTVGDRIYVLRKRRLSAKTKWISIGSAAAVLLFCSFLLLSPNAGNGTGTVIGIVLDDTQQPYGLGAEVRFPELGKTIKSNGQGFFIADGVANGSHKIEFVVNDQVIGTDYATVVTGEVTTVALRPTELAMGGNYAATTESVPAIPTSAATDVAQPASAEPEQTRSSSSRSSEAQLALAANIDGATLRIDGQVLGSGNLTYQKLKPGKRNYTITADGYQTASGTITLAPNKVTTLEVALAPVQAQQQPSAEDVALAQGEAAMNSGDFETAAARYTELIALQPQSTKAYLARAEAYTKASNHEGAVADLIQAGTLALGEGNYNQAYQAYDRACQTDPKSVQALLGRATTNLVRGQDLAAIADYESVLSIDRRSVQAYLGIGEARFNLGNYKEAISNFKDARTLEPENTEIYEYLMLSYLGDNDIKNVRKTFEKFKKMVGEEQLARMSRTEKYRLLMQVVSTGN